MALNLLGSGLPVVCWLMFVRLMPCYFFFFFTGFFKEAIVSPSRSKT
jgi:hypothetical protein